MELCIVHHVDLSLYIWVITCFRTLFFLNMNSYHLRCLGPAAADVECSEVYRCPYCKYVVAGPISLKGSSPLVCLPFKYLKLW